VAEAQSALRASAPPGLPGTPEVSVVFQTLAVATTARDALGFAVPDAIARATAPAVQALSVNNVRQAAGVYPIRNQLNNSVVAHVLVTEPRTYWRDLFKTIGWPALLAFGLSLLSTLVAVFVATTRLSRAVRRVNDDVMRVATGDFDSQVEILEREDEVGRLSESVERLRVTVKQAIGRLRRRLAAPAEVEKVGD
jgi:HAMP domain-containing protein